MTDYIPKWHQEIAIFSKIKPLLILEGNVLDSYQYPEEGSTPKGSILRLPQYLHFFFKDAGYTNIVFYDSLRGFYNTCEEGYIEHFASLAQASVEQGYIKADFKGAAKGNHAADMVRKTLGQNKEATVIVMDFASRYITSPDHMEQNEVDSFTVLLQASLDAQEVKSPGNGTLKNILLLIANKANDIPTWFYMQNPNVKMITLSTPTKEEREALVKSRNFPTFFAGEIYMQDQGYFSEHSDELEKIQDKFIALTEGFSFTEINGLRKLCKNEKIHMHDLCDVVDLYKYGIRENPWKHLDLSEIRNAKEHFESRVKGQGIMDPELQTTARKKIVNMVE